MAGLKIDIKGDASHFEKAIAKVTMLSVNTGLKLAQVGAAWVKGGLTVGIAASSAALGAFMVMSSKAAANIENMKAQFDLFTGSTEGTEKLVKDLRKIAVESPLELSDISEGARMLLTYGIAADKAAIYVNQLSEVSAGSAERFQRISYAFGQIASIGRLMGTELRQLTEAGFNPLEFISKKTGETMMQLKKRMEDGGVAVSEVEEALNAATSAGGRFEGMNAKMSQTFSGRVSMMKDQWDQLLQSFGTGMNDGLKHAVNAITEYMPQFQERLKTIGDFFGSAIAESVAGNNDKFVQIGDFIGTAIGVGLKASFQKGASELIVGMQKASKDKDSIFAVSGLGAIMKLLPQSKGLDFGELAAAHATNDNLAGKAAALMGTTPAPYSPSSSSPTYQNAASEALSKNVEKLLQSIDRKTAPLKY